MGEWQGFSAICLTLFRELYIVSNVAYSYCFKTPCNVDLREEIINAVLEISANKEEIDIYRKIAECHDLETFVFKFREE